jgi:hypothetical protein
MSREHARQFIDLWIRYWEVQVDDAMEDDITWKFSINGEYSATSSYKAQFLGATFSKMNTLVWKVWAPPRIKELRLLAFKDHFKEHIEELRMAKLWPLSSL